MIFEDRVVVPASPERAWELLTDVPAVAPCFPGATLESAGGDEFHGSVRVKVGPVVVEYAGTAVMLSRDAASRTVVIEAKGREKRGAGLATAVVTAVLSPSPDGTEVQVHTDLRVTGRLAQFGSAVLRPVSAALISQFADNLSGLLSASGSPPDVETSLPQGREVAPAGAADLLHLASAGVPVRRLAAVSLAAGVVALIVILLRRRRRA